VTAINVSEKFIRVQQCSNQPMKAIMMAIMLASTEKSHVQQ